MTKIIGYALAIGADKRLSDAVKTVAMPAFTYKARSEDEAVGIGLRLARQEWPEAEGYTNHWVRALPVPELESADAT